MPSTYTLISSNVLSTSAASVTFSAIPSTYTDLVLRGSTRVDAGTPVSIQIRYNASSGGTDYSYVNLRGNGSAASSDIISGNDSGAGAYANTVSTMTASTFSSWEFYVPSYLSSTKKPSSFIAAQETNATAANINAAANLWQGTAAITSIAFALSANNFVSGSSFYLYGIKNS
jgi:hypothetical protein